MPFCRVETLRHRQPFPDSRQVGQHDSGVGVAVGADVGSAFALEGRPDKLLGRTEMRCEQVGRPVGVTVDRSLHDLAMFVEMRGALALEPCEGPLAIGRIEHRSAEADQPTGPAAGDQAQMEIAMGFIPGRIALLLGPVVAEIARNPGQAMVGDKHMFLPRTGRP